MLLIILNVDKKDRALPRSQSYKMCTLADKKLGESLFLTTEHGL